MSEPTSPPQDRRRRTRYPIELSLHFMAVPQESRVSRAGDGRSVDISSAGLHFRTSARLHAGDAVVAALEWPVPSGTTTPLVLLLSGRIVWKKGADCGMFIARHDLVPATAEISGMRQLTNYVLPEGPDQTASARSDAKP